MTNVYINIYIVILDPARTMDEKFSADIPLEERDEVEKVFHYLIGDDGTGPEDIIDRFSQNSHQYEKVK